MIYPGKNIVNENSVSTLIVHNRKCEMKGNGLNNRIITAF
jgi:hypothetical protein